MNHKYYELVITLTMQRDIEMPRAYETFSRMISFAMLGDEGLKALHGQNQIRSYTFCLPCPLEPDKIYKKNRLYVMKIRSLDLEFALKMKALLPKSQPGIAATELRTHSYRYISALKSVTPVAATLENRSWTPEDGIILLMQRCHSNAVRKYNAVFGELDAPENFMESIEVLNRKPIKIPYKSNSILGSKIRIGVRGDEVSQRIAFAALGGGVLEKNALGFGYCMAE